MRRFISFVHKEFCHILRDWRTMLILLVYPVVLIVLFGYAVTTEVKNVRVAVLDLSHDAVTSKICGHIAASRYLVMVAAPHSRPEVETMFRRGDIDVAVIFESGFADNIRHGGDARVQILADGSEPNQAAVRVQYVEQVLAAAKSDVVGDAVGRGFTIVPVTRMLYNPQQKSEYNFVPGVIGMILLLICAMMSSIAIVREKESGTIEQINVTPVGRFSFIFSKLIPYWLIGLFMLAWSVFLAWLIYGMLPAGSILLLFLYATLFLLIVSSLGLIVSNYSSTMQQAALLMFFFLVIFILMSGMLTPVSAMPEWAQLITYVNPLRYFIEVLRALYLKGSGFADLQMQFFAMLAYAAVSWTWAICSYKKSA